MKCSDLHQGTNYLPKTLGNSFVFVCHGYYHYGSLLSAYDFLLTLEAFQSDTKKNQNPYSAVLLTQISYIAAREH